MLWVQGRVVLQCGMPARRLAEPQEALQGLCSGPPGPECRKVTVLPVVPVLKRHPPVLGLCLSLPWMQPSLLFSVSLFFLLVRVALKLRSLRIHPPRLCRFAVF